MWSLHRLFTSSRSRLMGVWDCRLPWGRCILLMPSRPSTRLTVALDRPRARAIRLPVQRWRRSASIRLSLPGRAG